MKGTPALQSPSAVCVDYSAGAGGPLVAFRFDGGFPVSGGEFLGLGEIPAVEWSGPLTGH